jgi:hypothetical protein
MAFHQIGVLTLAKTDDTPSFHAFRRGMRRNGYIEGQDFSLHFRFASDDTKLDSLANDLFSIPKMKLIVTGGNNALKAVNTIRKASFPKVNIVQIVGGDPPGEKDPGISGLHINCLKTCKKQVDRLKKLQVKNISILVDNHLTNPFYNDLVTYANGQGLTVNTTIDAPTVKDLNNVDFSKIVDSFMIIPNGMFFDNCDKIIQGVDNLKIPKIYPEREYFDASTNQTHVYVHGHSIRQTYNDAADHVYHFLEGLKKLDPAEAVPDEDPEPIALQTKRRP